MEESEALLRLQAIDLETLRIRREAQELPQRAKIEAAQVASKKVASELRKIVGRRKDLEMEVAGQDRLRNDAQRQVDEAQASFESSDDPRAVMDLESRLDILAKRMEKIDYRQNQTMEELIQAEKAEQNARAVQARLEGEVASLAGSLREQLLDAQKRLADLAREREETAALIDPEWQAAYAKASERFHGRAVESLDGNKPSCCRVTLQPSQYADLKRRRLPVDECPYCHRILVTDWH